MLLFLQTDPANSHGFLFRRFDLRGAPNIQTRDKTPKTPRDRNSNTSHGSFKSFQKHHTQCHRPYDFPTLGQIKTLANQAENLVSQQGMPWNPENIFVTMLAFASPAQADLINHTYWAYIPDLPLL